VPIDDIDVSGLRPLFAARSVAIVGASNDPTRIGGRPVQYLLRSGFRGAIYPVNPTRSEVQGLKAYPDLDAVPGEIELVVVAVPTPLVGGTIEAAAAKGARAAIIFSAGFAEVGGEGIAAQAHLARRIRELGMRALGPNCLGFYNSTIGLTPTFASFLQEPPPENGRIALATQSGAFGSYLFMLGRRRGIRVSQWTSTGNEMDVGIADAIAWYAEDASVSVIACVLEGVPDGRRFLRALATARAARKPVLLMKCGATAAGAAAARAHTAARPVDDAAFDAVVRQGGALRLFTTEELLDAMYGLQMRPPLRGRRLGILSISGGAGVAMADVAVEHGFELPPMPGGTQERLMQANRLATMSNPVDLTAQALNDPSLVKEPARAMLSEGGYDAIASFFMNYLASPVNGPQMRAALAEATEGFSDRTIAIASMASPEVVRAFEERGFLMFEDPARLVATLAAMASVGEALRAPAPEPATLSPLPLLDGSESDPARCRAFLARAGISVTDEGGEGDARPAGGRGEDLELVLTAHHDPTFGTVIRLARKDHELETELSVGVGALGRAEARAMLAGLRCRWLLEGTDDRPPMDAEALVDAIARLSWLAAANEGRFDRIEVDPLVVRSRGAGCVVYSARVTSRRPD